MARKEKKEQEFKIVFENDIDPELFREFREGIISANIQEYVPAHQQEELLNKFVEAGLMTP